VTDKTRPSQLSWATFVDTPTRYVSSESDIRVESAFTKEIRWSEERASMPCTAKAIRYCEISGSCRLPIMLKIKTRNSIADDLLLEVEFVRLCMMLRSRRAITLSMWLVQC
jgi:hypothetical protein